MSGWRSDRSVGAPPFHDITADMLAYAKSKGAFIGMRRLKERLLPCPTSPMLLWPGRSTD